MRLTCAVQSAVTDAVSTASRMYLCPRLSRFSDLVVHKGAGAYVWTAEGRKVLDMSSGIGATSTGHCHPRVVEAIQRQASDFIHAQQNCFASNPATRELLQRLEDVIPGHLDTAFFCNSGAEAVENAVKLARAVTGKPNIIALEGGFHGRTMGAMALTSSKTVYREGFAPLMPGTFFSPYPQCLHCRARQLSPHGSRMYRLPPYQPPFNAQGPPQQCCGSPLEALRWMLKQQTAPSETAAVILEPILGEGGFLVPPPGYLQGVQQICRDNGMLLIMDEVQSGVGRTGKWWAYEHFPGLEPDILIFAKGIASGFPFAGLATAGPLWHALPHGTFGGTYGGNPIACAAASATLDVIREERLLENAAARGQQLMEGLVQLSREFPIIDVRGRGLMIGFELSPDAGPGSASKLCQAALQQDMLLLTAGAREIVRLLPPLSLRPEEADEALTKLRLAFSHVFPSPSAP